MNINNKVSQPTYQNQLSFKSHSAGLRDVDDICRRVVMEFPSTYSNTKLLKYNTLSKYEEGSKLKSYCEKLLGLSRKNYGAPEDVDCQFGRELADMKKYKVSNCGELADATQIALKLNGYKDVKIMELYAYNKDTKKMRNLDHSVVGLNFELPKDYKYNVYHTQYNLSPEFRVYPQNDSIIVDAWSGKTEYAKRITSDYNTDRALVRGTNKFNWETVPLDEKLLKEGEEFCFVPLYQCFPVSDGALSYFGKTYDKLILSKNKGKVDLTQSKTLKMLETIPEEKVREARELCKMGEYKKIHEQEIPRNTFLSNFRNVFSTIKTMF